MMNKDGALVVVAVFQRGRFYVSNAFPSDEPDLCEAWMDQFHDGDQHGFTFKSILVPLAEMQ